MRPVRAHITGTVWSVDVTVGDEVAAGDCLVVIESMKMELPVEADVGGRVTAVYCEEGQPVEEGDTLLVLHEG